MSAPPEQEVTDSHPAGYAGRGRIRKLARLVLVALAAWLAIGIGPPSAAETPAPDTPRLADTEASTRLGGAVLTQLRTRARLRLVDGTACADAGVVAYRRSDALPGVVDQWYVASQLWADAELLSATRVATRAAGGRAAMDLGNRGVALAGGEPEARCHVGKGFLFLDRLWDGESGGYYPRSDPDGLQVERQVRYADDNALAGLALLAGAEAETDAPSRRRYLDAARAQADFLVGSNLWDDTFGGGFWWNTNAGDRYEGKPAQTNALAAFFFSRLHQMTGDEVHRTWALRTLAWLDATLWDPTQQLYRWSIRYEDPPLRSGPAVLSSRYFNYDQGIAIQAQLLAAGLDGDREHLLRARGLGRALHARFWGRERGGYNLVVGIERVYASYGAWASLGHLALYDWDGDLGWLEMARANADALAAALGEADGGYAYRHYRCTTPNRPGCEDREWAWVVDRTRDTSAQAWMQHLQAALARRLATPRPPDPPHLTLTSPPAGALRG